MEAIARLPNVAVLTRESPSGARVSSAFNTQLACGGVSRVVSPRDSGLHRKTCRGNLAEMECATREGEREPNREWSKAGGRFGRRFGRRRPGAWYFTTPASENGEACYFSRSFRSCRRRFRR
jgi:hypothetical protein